MQRRRLLMMLAAGTPMVAGCGFDQRLSDGDIRVTNQDDSTHTVTMHLRRMEDGSSTETFQGTAPSGKSVTLDPGETETLTAFIPSEGNWLVVAETEVGERSREIVTDGACVIVENGVGRVNVEPGEIC